MNQKQLKIIKWFTRIISLVIILFGLPFYLGYGNPLPFAKPEYDIFDNIWLSTLPLIFIGLAIGWKWEKAGGYLIVIPIIIALVIGFIFLKEGLPSPMFIPMIIGILYLFVGYKKVTK